MAFLLFSVIHLGVLQPIVLYDFMLLSFASGLVIGMSFPLAESQERSAQTDFLTELPNRSRGYTRLVSEIERSQRYNEPFSIILFDIDHFKKINDECGHPCGDAVLQQVAAFTNSRIRRSDLLSRWGGEEFLLLMTHCDLPSARLKADHMRQQIKSRPFHKDIFLTASFGVTTYYPFDTANTMLERADDALYRAKRNGRNCVEVE
jgi:diguanylate cyclase (GGDEF)-like protein